MKMHLLAGIALAVAVPLFAQAPVVGVKMDAPLIERTKFFGNPTKVQGRSVIRVQVGQFDCTREDVAMIAAVVAALLSD